MPNKKKLLITGDDNIFVSVLAQFFTEKNFGLDIVKENNLAYLDNAISDNPPDIVLLDINFPNTNAVEILNKILPLRKDGAPRVLVLTKRVELQDIAEEFDIDGFMPKTVPFDVNLLMDQVRRAAEPRDRAKAIILDNPKNAAVQKLKLSLGLYDFKAVSAFDFGNLIVAALKNNPDIIIINYQQKSVVSEKELPEKIRSVVREIRQKKNIVSKRDVIIATYSTVEGEFRWEALAAGADLYVGRLENPDKIVMEIKNFYETLRLKDVEEERIREALKERGFDDEEPPKLEGFSPLR